MAQTPFIPRHGITVNAFSVSASNGALSIGANVYANNTQVTVGNSTIYTYHSATQVGVGSFLYANATSFFAGNSTINASMTSTQIQIANSTSNTFLNSNGFFVGNATVGSALYQTYWQCGTAHYANSTYLYNSTPATLGGVIYTTSGTLVGVGTSGPSVKFQVSGDIAATGNITTAYSDMRLKVIREGISDVINKLESLDGFVYEPAELTYQLDPYANSAPMIGVSAQKVQAVFPELVSLAVFDRLPDGTSATGQNYLTVDYSRFAPILIEAIKDLNKRLKAIENK